MGFSGSSPDPGYQIPGAIGYRWMVSEAVFGGAEDVSLVSTELLKPKTTASNTMMGRMYFILYPLSYEKDMI